MATKKITELTNKQVTSICRSQLFGSWKLHQNKCVDCPLCYRGNCLKKLIKILNNNKGCLDVQVEVEE